MPEDLSQPEVAELQKLEDESPLVWLLELEQPSTPAKRFRLNNSNQAVNYGTTTAGVALVYSSYDFSVSRIRRDSEGGLFNLEVSISNVTREIQAAIELFDGLIGQPARAMLIDKALLLETTPILEIRGEVVSGSSNANRATFEIGAGSLFNDPFPKDRVSRDYCARIDFGGSLCGYDTSVGGALQTCDKTLEGPDGCRVHGDAEVAAGLTRRHPARFGGFQGVPRLGGLGT